MFIVLFLDLMVIVQSMIYIVLVSFDLMFFVQMLSLT